MSQFVTLAQAKMQAGIPTTDTSMDTQLQLWLDAAEKFVLGYLKTEAPDPGEDVPLAILLQFTENWRFHGDDPADALPKTDLPGEPSIQIKRLLYRRRDPAMT